MGLSPIKVRYWLVTGAIALACFAAATLSTQVLCLKAQASPVWAPAGIAVAALLLYGCRVWTGVAIGLFLFALSQESPWTASAIAAGSSSLSAIAACRLLQWLNFQASLRRLRDVLLFILVAVILSPAINATLGSVNGVLAGTVSWQTINANWWTLWLGDGMGILVLSPVLLTWLGRPLPPLPPLGSLFNPASKHRCLGFRAIEAGIWAGSLCFVSWLVFESTPETAIARYPLEYLPFPFLVWATLRMGQRGTLLGILMVSAIALWGAAQGSGPFIAKSGGDLVQAVMLLQAFIGVMAMTTLVLVAAISERWDGEQRFRGMFEGAAIGIGLDNLDGTILASNTALQSMLGYSRDELSRMTFDEFSHPEDLPADKQLFADMIAGQRDSYQIEKRHIRKDGEIVWIRLTNSLVRDESGNPKFTIGMVENITERKQAEAALQQSEARFRVVAETAACAIMVYQGPYLRYINPATEVITEYSRQELLSILFWELAHPDFRDLVRQRGIARQQGDAIPSRYEIKILTKTGKVRWVDFTAGLITYEGKPAGLATAYDITDRKQAEAQLHLAAERERLLAEIAQRIRASLNLEEILSTTVSEVRQFLKADRVFIAQFEATGCCRTVAESVDDPWQSLMGWITDFPVVQEIQSLFQPDQLRVVNDIDQVEQPPCLTEYYHRAQVKAGMGVPILGEGAMFGVLIVNQCRAPRQWQPFEVDLLRQLGTQVEIAIQQAQLYQKVQLLAANLESQVEERTAELQQRMQELQQLNQVKDVLLHAVSHDLKTPIQGMLMVLNNLRNKGNGSDPVAIAPTMLDCMIHSSDQQLNLLTSLMENHADQEPKPLLNCEPVQLSLVLQSALEQIHPWLDSNRAVAMNLLSPDLPLVKADTIQIRRVFEHLLGNAVKHNCPGVTMTINATLNTPVVATPSPCSSTPCLPMLYCTVEDDGRGMPPEQCDRLFQLYVRGIDNPHLTGIGLGLHRCRQIIIAHGGQIGVVSQPGKGSRFWFTLPLA